MDYSFAADIIQSNLSETVPIRPIISYAEFLQMMLEPILEYRASIDINKHGLPVVMTIGCCTNLLAFVVMLQLLHIPMCNYMAALALVDISILLGPCLTQWLLTQDVDLKSHNTASCRFLNFQTHWSFAMSAWILVTMTVDRYIAISFPLRARIWSTPMRARVTILILATILAIVNSHFLFTMEVKHAGQNVCVAYDKYEHFIQDTWLWLDAAIYSFAPFYFLFLFNILIIKNHRRYRRINVTLTTPTTPSDAPSPPSNVNRRLTITLLTVTFTFIILTAPRALLTIIRRDVFDYTPAPNVLKFKILANYMLTSSVVNLLMFINHGTNFFLYCLTGKKFRQQLIHIFCKTWTLCTKQCVKSKKQRNVQSETCTTQIP